jgi:tetratricopeptide (TPR) repeat protein
MIIHQCLAGSPHGFTGRRDLEIDCHRRLRGPYTGLGTLLRAIVPDAWQRWPDLVRQHVIAILSVAPELRSTVAAGPETLTSLAVPKERTRIYPANRTRRLAHSAVEFLESYAERADQNLTILFHSVAHADNTDQEFLSIFVRRARSGRVRAVIALGDTPVSEELTAALARYAERVEAAEWTYPPDDRDQETLLRAYIDADGTSKHPAEIAAYDNADPAVRARLHTARAELLTALGERSLRIGAVPYHHEHGVDPRGAGVDELMAAADYCAAMGFYHALLDLGMRGREIADPDTQMQSYWFLSGKACSSLSMLGRTEESEPMYIELRNRYTDAGIHMSTGYALGMIYTRFHPREQRNHQLAGSYLNSAILNAGLLEDSEERAFSLVFMRNGRALVEMHLGRLPEALRLVDEGLTYLEKELPPDKHRLHRSVLVHNRGRVYAALGRLEEALADFDTVIELDPNYPDYYFDRADIRRQLGDRRGALADYDHATTLTAPFHELHYNRADLLVDLDDRDGARRELAYVIELEPDQLDARVNLVGLLIEDGETEAAQSYTDEGLRLHPNDPRLLHARGLLAVERGDTATALVDFDAALEADPGLVVALSSRAVLAFDTGALANAIADLDAAVTLSPDNPDLLYNRGFVHQAAGDFAAAVRDYTLALEQPDADRAELLHQRGICYAELGDTAASEADRAAREREPELAGTS